MNMKELAKILGVSRQTVSAVLNGKTWVSSDTRDRVLTAIRQYNYMPNQHAVSLTGKGIKLLGVVLRDISNPFYTQIAMGIESVARSQGYSILYHNTFEKHDYEVEAIRSLISFRVSGIIVSPIQLGVDLTHLAHVGSLGIPLVSIDRLPDVRCHSISFENHQAVRTATNYLVEKGHRDIAFIQGPHSVTTARERLQGFTDSMQAHGLPTRKEWMVDPGTTDKERHEAIHNLLKNKQQRPSAIFCFNDLLAVSVYKAAHELGIRIPDELSVMGFDDIEIASLLGPPLTTVRTDSYEVGEEAARLVLSELADATVEPRDIRHLPELVERGSVAARRG